MIPQTYVPYHVHSMLSNGTTNIDSITNFRSYVDKAKEYGMPALGISEHGNIFEWVHKKEAIEAAGMKYLHCVEAYLTEDSNVEDKHRDNYHCVLIAKNYGGVHEINLMMSHTKAYNRSDHHFYYMPRITFDELFATSNNVIITSACLGGVMNNGTPILKEKALAFFKKNTHRCFLEIQHHNCSEQIEYNRLLYELSKETGIPLIAGTDTHALNDIHMDGRAILQKAKDVYFANEEEWDLTFKSTEELIKAYEKQKSLPMDVVCEAINNTVKMAEMVEEFKLDYSPKYPKLYADSEKVFKQKVNEGVKRRGIQSYPNYQEYVDRIHNEYETYKHNNAIDFLLLEEDYKSEMRRRNIKYGYSRGSVSGSVIAYLLGITEVDSVKYNLNFERFMNRERVSLADVDTDWLSEDRKVVKDYLFTKEGLYCCDIVTFNTIALKGAIRDVCRALYRDYNLYDKLSPKWKKKYDEYIKCCEYYNGQGQSMPMPDDLQEEIDKVNGGNYIKIAEEIIAECDIDENKARKKYPDVFKYVDLLNGVVVSVGNHPAGCVVSPFPVDSWFGTFTTTSDEYPISVLNMKEIDSLNFVKLDILGLDNIGLIYKTCEAVGIPFLTPDNTPPDDMDVWNSIKEDTTMIFQWESASATAYLQQLFSEKTIERIKEKNENFSYMDLLSIGNGAIRPAGESYRDKLAQGIYQDNGHEALNNFLAPTLGYCVYQEQVIEFLHSFCGYTMGEADIVRRGFAKKTGTDKFIPKIKAGFGVTMNEKYGVSEDEANVLIVNFIKVIEDASSYLFSKNHADPYSWIGYICGYLRYYYPLEFITTALNIFEGKEDKSLAIINYAKKQGIKISPIKFRHSIAEYNFSKETNEIFKGISSIKFMNTLVANEIYELRNNKYNSFSELLNDLYTKTTINARQLRILINLDFFSEFGDANLLMEQYKFYDTFSDRKQFKKDELTKLGIDFITIRPYAKKETPKMFTDVDFNSFVLVAMQKIKAPSRKLSDKIKSQIEHLGYVDIIDDKYAKMAAVLSVDTKYSPRLTLYSLRYGTVSECKIDKRSFNKCKLEVGDIIKIKTTDDRPKTRKNEDGEWEAIPGTKEMWITSYHKVENL